MSLGFDKNDYKLIESEEEEIMDDSSSDDEIDDCTKEDVFVETCGRVLTVLQTYAENQRVELLNECTLLDFIRFVDN